MSKLAKMMLMRDGDRQKRDPGNTDSSRYDRTDGKSAFYGASERQNNVDGNYRRYNQVYPGYTPGRYPRYEDMSRENQVGFDMDGSVYRNNGNKRFETSGRAWASDDMRGDQHTYNDRTRYMPFSQKTAEEWTEKMKNADGSTGAHWTMEQVKQVMQQHNMDFDPAEFYAVVNSIYSDYCTVAKKHNVNTIDFYADMAKAWLDDRDAVENKTAAYYECIVQHR